jgi:hypothetical protein
MSAPPGHPTRLRTSLRLALWVGIAVASALLALWLWSRICRFPTIAWNDMRLAPSIALAQGLPVYASATEGVISTWMYGPLPLLFFYPVSWVRTAGDAMMVGALMNMALTLVPISCVVWLWPAGQGVAKKHVPAIVALLLTVAMWPELHYSVHFSDNLAIACGLLGNLILIRADRGVDYWLAAAVAVAALGCKQISLGIPLAQILFLSVSQGAQAGALHAIRCLVVGAAIGCLAIAKFGWDGLWFTLVEIPKSLVWSDQTQRLQMVSSQLILHIGVPVLVIGFCRRAFLRPELLLPSLAWICSLPLGLAALLKTGGWINSLYSFQLWLPAVLSVAFNGAGRTRFAPSVYAAALAIVGASTLSRITREPRLDLKPQLQAYREAEGIAALNRNAVWFPLQPTITLYSERRHYHDEDGFYIRQKAKKEAGINQIVSGLPPHLSVLAFRHDWADWGIARRMLAPNARRVDTESWQLWFNVPENPAR